MREEWVRKIHTHTYMCIYLYIGILLSYKKNEKMPFTAMQMDLELIILSEISQKEKAKYHTISLICGILNMTQMKLFMKQNQRHRKQIYGYQ